MTVKEVAALAGVSSAAISRYLNGGSLSEEKRERIRAAIEQTGFRPNTAGQMLRTGRVNQIGVIAPKISSESVGQVTAGIAGVLGSTRYLMLLGNCNKHESEELDYLEAMQENRVAGIILMGTCLTPAHKAAFEKCGVPLVVTGQNFAGMPCVYHDDFYAAKELTARMLAKGRRRIAYIGVNEKDPAAGLARRKGVQEALKEAGLDGNGMPRLAGHFDQESGYSCMTELLAMDAKLDGVVCATDMIALGAMNALKQMGRRVPEDIGIAGIGNSWAGTIMTPQLTTVDLYQSQCGVEAARMLLQLIEEKDEPTGPVRQMMLGYTVIERGSF